MNEATPQHLAQAKRVADLLKCLAHPTRLMTVCFLLRRECYAAEIFDHLGTTKGNISQHLTTLVQQGILARREHGNRNYYRIADDNMRDLITFLEKRFCPRGGLTIKEKKS